MACPLCQTPLGEGEPTTACPECATLYHAECWEDNGGCGVYGCAGVPETRPRDTLEIPAAWWGKENKPCPSCGQEILAMARRCRHCGAAFASERPRESGEFQREKALEKKASSLRTTAILLLAMSVVPCLAPVAGLAGLAWYVRDKEEIRTLPPLYQGVFRMALILSGTMTILSVLAFAGYWLVG